MKKETVYIITGANGHLGSTIIRQLAEAGETIRGLILPGETPEAHPRTTYLEGDVRDPQSLNVLFQGLEDAETLLIHTAGIIDISNEVSKPIYQVNVEGTKNVVAACLHHGVTRMVHVSSVHAIPEKDHLHVITEVSSFSPDLVVGGYAKTKAEATQAVLDAVDSGLDAVVVHPSGILGPYDRSGNHLVQMVKDCVTGKLPAGVKGGYDFVDVRDVAAGCIAAARKGKKGECYILSNRHYGVKDLLAMIRAVNGGRRLPILPLWLARAFAPLLGLYAKIKKERPLYTKYSLYTLNTNDQFSHDKATSELGYLPRELFETIRDTVLWLNPRAGKKRRKIRVSKTAGSVV